MDGSADGLPAKGVPGETDYELARRLLDEGDCTLVVARDGVGRKFYRRGVADLLSLVDGGGETLKGACVADKVIGKAAAHGNAAAETRIDSHAGMRRDMTWRLFPARPRRIRKAKEK